jgi:hypothetical protein
MFPRHATCSTGEFSYYFDDENYLNVHYQGSQSFRHKLWNFESDCVTCYDSVTGIFVAYSVERYRYDKIDREVVQLTPMYTTFSHSAARLVAEQPLVHFEPVVHGDKATWATWKVQTRSSNYRTVARTGQLAHADITTSLADVLNTSQDTAQRKISSFHVHDAMGRKDNDHHVIAAWIKDGAPNNKLEATLPLKTPLVKRETLSSDDESSDDDLDDDDAPSSSSTPLDYIPPSHDTTSPGGTVIHQLSTTELADEPPRPAMKQLGNPVTSANVYSPSTDRDSIVNTASSRIVPFLPKDNSINESLDPHIAAFIQYLAPESPNLMPHDIQMILDAQNRPAQKSLNDRILNGFSKPMSQLFTKGEVYSTPKDPRPITPLENIDRLFSATVYASASKWLSSLGWYASGLPPCKVAQSVAHVCNQAREEKVCIAETDFSRMDGHISWTLRRMERCVLLAIFDSRFHGFIEYAHNKMYTTPVMAGGARVPAGPYRRSGYPDTSFGNTICNAFIAFLASRYANQPFVPGLYLGDDGITPCNAPSSYQQAAVDCGMKIELQLRKPGDPVSFLSRFYGPRVWYGDPNSCCDIMRALPKLYVSKNNDGYDPRTRMAEKFISYYFTDSKTPVIGDIVTLFVERWMTREFDIKRNEHGVKPCYVGTCTPLTRTHWAMGMPCHYPSLKRLLCDYPRCRKVHKPHYDKSYRPEVFWSRYDLDQQYHQRNESWMYEILDKQNPTFDVNAFTEWIESCSQLDNVSCCDRLIEGPPVPFDSQSHGIYNPAKTTSPMLLSDGSDIASSSSKSHSPANVLPDISGTEPPRELAAQAGISGSNLLVGGKDDIKGNWTFDHITSTQSNFFNHTENIKPTSQHNNERKNPTTKRKGPSPTQSQMEPRHHDPVWKSQRRSRKRHGRRKRARGRTNRDKNDGTQ